MVTRHSKQIPMPHKGLRGAPETDFRKHDTPASAMAAQAVLPAGTETGFPFT
ncbi:MAG: hypothetical protein ABSG67_08930 [Thermoguttaceae bacterium]|jgi:hypothetical protein